MRASTVRWISVGVALAAIAAAIAVTVARRRDRVLSDPVSELAPELGDGAQVLRPNLVDAELVIPDRPHNPWELDDPERYERMTRRRSFTFSTNSRGLRGPEIELPAPGFRVLCAGDSVTFGWGVDYAQSWPAVLGARLELDVVNAGWPAARWEELVRWLHTEAPALDADVVLLAKTPQGDPQELARYVAALEALAAAIAPARLAVVEPPVSTFLPVPDADGLGEELPDDDDSGAVAEDDYTLDRLPPSIPHLELVHAFRAALPLPGVVGEMGPEVQRMVRLPDGEVLVEAPAPPDGIAPSILAAFERDPALREPLFLDEGHPDAEGYALFAAEVARWLRDEQLVPQSSSANRSSR